MLKLSDRYDCNPDEILEGFAQKVQVCSYCLKPAKVETGDWCTNCTKELLEQED